MAGQPWLQRARQYSAPELNQAEPHQPLPAVEPMIMRGSQMVLTQAAARYTHTSDRYVTSQNPGPCGKVQNQEVEKSSRQAHHGGFLRQAGGWQLCCNRVHNGGLPFLRCHGTLWRLAQMNSGRRCIFAAGSTRRPLVNLKSRASSDRIPQTS
jgi:hypothetical protein